MPTTREGLASALDGRYVLIRELGSGGMATVWLANDLRHNRRVAVKVLQSSAAETLGVDRFLREIEIAATLQHPHILPLFDSGLCRVDGEDIPFYVMPFVAGESLRDRLRRERPSVQESELLVREVAGALDYAHMHGVVHRDIKPENILLSEGHALVADFGIARAVGLAVDAKLTETGTSLGTPAYMSPEQVLGDRDIGPASDVYSLGCVLYEMLSGEPPFTAATRDALLVKRFMETPAPIRTLRSDVPESMDHAIQRALAREPAARWTTAGEFAQALLVSTARPDRGELSIAVLPFDNLSPDPESGYFAEGLAEELIHDLSKIGSLRVTSRSSAIAAREKSRDLREVGRMLNVSYVLEGSVRRAQDNLRVTAQLIEAINDHQIWADKYTGTLQDVFKVQEQLSRTIVRALQVILTPDEDRRLRQRPVADSRAYDCYLLARQEILRSTPDALQRAARLVQEGMALSGENDLLLATLGYIRWNQFNIDFKADRILLTEAQSYATRALELNPESAWAHVVLGLILWPLGQCNIPAFRRSLELQETSDALMWLGMTEAEAGLIAEGRRRVRRAAEIDPLTPMVRAALGIVEAMDGKAALGATLSAEGMALDPKDFVTAFFHALVLLAADRRAESKALFGRAGEALGDTTFGAVASLMHRALGNDVAAFRQQYQWIADNYSGLDSQYLWIVADALALAGERDLCLTWLEKAVHYGFYNQRYLRDHDPALAIVRGHPRFDALLAEAQRRQDDLRASLPARVTPLGTADVSTA